ncbi:hypothetical protein [Pseudescherichia sp.]|uniref:hypothetical protein n=1 Tax=Pseudescherichia sp. TaxID=2055881 RepID=UPI00289E8A90|nr:hypothetical protein [Pseudescherichia sp.]
MSDKYAALRATAEGGFSAWSRNVTVPTKELLALLAERDADKRRIAELGEALENRNAELGKYAGKLEARTLTVKLPPVMRIDEPGVSFNAYGQSGIQNALYEACAAAGISLKIEGA